MMDFIKHLTEDTTFWVAFSSVLCFIVVYRKAKAPLLENLDRRTDTIRARLDEAENLYREAEALLADYRQRQKDALKEADTILQSAQRRAEGIIRQAEEDVQRAVAHQEDAARLRIQRAEQEVIEAIRDAMVKAALNRVEGQLQAKGDDTSALDQSLQAVSKSFH